MYLTVSSVKEPLQNERLLSTFHEESTQNELIDGHSFRHIVQTYIIRINSSIGVGIGTGDFCQTYLPATNT